MKDDAHLLISTIANVNLRAYRLSQDVRGLARDVGELQALAYAVADGEVTSQECDDRLSHGAHLWREQGLEPKRPIHRCSGRSTDAT